MWYAVQNERGRRLSEPDLFIESSGILLGLYINAVRPKMPASCLYAFKHNPFSEAIAALCGDNTPYRHLVHMGTGRADSAYRNNFIAVGEPDMDGGLVISVEVLIDAVLLHDKNL